MNSLRDLKGWIIDLDGVLWRGQTPLPGLSEFFGELRRRELPFVLATNNARQTAERVQAKLAGFGVAVQPQEVLTSAEGTAGFLTSQLPPGSPVYVIGEPALLQALEGAGFRLLAGGDGARAVVVGIDFELTWEKLAEAAYGLQQGALFIGTNPDPSFPTERGEAPGNGATLAALTATTGKSPTVFGKPERHMFQAALARLGTPPERTVVVGDRLETDILGGQRSGMKTILVLTGVTGRAELVADSTRPDWIFADLAELSRAMGT